MSGLIVGLVLGVVSLASEDGQEIATVSEENCNTAYCQYVQDQSDPKIQNSLKQFPQLHRPSFVDINIEPVGYSDQCNDYACSRYVPGPVAGRHYRVESGNTVLNTVLGGAVGAVAGGAALDTPGGIGFGLLGAILGNRSASLEKSKLKEKREKAIRARERTLNNFNDVVFDPSAPIPVDAHFLGARVKKSK